MEAGTGEKSPVPDFMKQALILFSVIFLLSPKVCADQIQIQFTCWPQELQTKFLENGKKLDLSANDRTDDSWGYLFSKGSEYVIYTYHAVTGEELDIVKKVVNEVELKER